MKAYFTLFQTELKLSLRGMDMMIFGIIFPVVMAVILGLVFGNKPAFDGASYSFYQQSFGALAAITICASGVMGLPLVLSDYRNKKILKRYRVTPANPWLILLVQMSVYFVYCTVSLLLVAGVSILFFDYHMTGALPVFLAAYLLVLLAIFSIGLLIAGLSPSIPVTNLLCSALYFPMLIFSGATLPYEVMPNVLQRIADVMPLTQGIKLLKAASLGLPFQQAWFAALLMLAFTLVCTGLAVRYFRWE